MSGSAKAGTIAERHACELRVLPEFAGARSSEARFRRIFFSLTKTYMDVGNTEAIPSSLRVSFDSLNERTAVAKSFKMRGVY